MQTSCRNFRLSSLAVKRNILQQFTMSRLNANVMRLGAGCGFDMIEDSYPLRIR